MALVTRLWLGLLGLLALFSSPVTTHDVGHLGSPPVEAVSICYIFVSTWLTVPGSGPTPLPGPPKPSSTIPLSVSTTTSPGAIAVSPRATFPVTQAETFFYSVASLLDDPSGELIGISSNPSVDWIILDPLDKAISGVVPRDFPIITFPVNIRVRYTRNGVTGLPDAPLKNDVSYEADLVVVIIVRPTDSTLPPAPSLVAGQPYSIPLKPYLREQADYVIAAISSPPYPWIALSPSLGNLLQGLVPGNTPPGVISITLTVGNDKGPTYTVTFTVVVVGPSDTVIVVPPASLVPGQTFNIGLLPHFRHPGDVPTRIGTAPISPWVQLDRNAKSLTGTVPPNQTNGPVVVTVTTQPTGSAPVYTIQVPLLIVAAGASNTALPPAEGSATGTKPTAVSSATASPTNDVIIAFATPGILLVIPIAKSLRNPGDVVTNAVTKPTSPWLQYDATLKALVGIVPVGQVLGEIAVVLSVVNPEGKTYSIGVLVEVLATIPTTTLAITPSSSNIGIPSGSPSLGGPTPIPSPSPILDIVAGVPFTFPLERFLRSPTDRVVAVTTSLKFLWFSLDQTLQSATGQAPATEPSESFEATLNVLDAQGNRYSVILTVRVSPATSPVAPSSLPSPTSGIFTIATITAGESFSAPLLAFLSGPSDTISPTITTDPSSPWIQVKGGNLTGTVPPGQPTGPVTVTFQVVRPDGTLSSPISVRLFVRAGLPTIPAPLVPTAVSTTNVASQTPAIVLPPFPVYPGLPFSIRLVGLLLLQTDTIITILSTDPVSQWVKFSPEGLLGNVPVDQPAGTVLVIIQVRDVFSTLYSVPVQLLVQPLGQSPSISTPNFGVPATSEGSIFPSPSASGLPSLPLLIVNQGQKFEFPFLSFLNSPGDQPQRISTIPAVTWLTLDSATKGLRGTVPDLQAEVPIALTISGLTTGSTPFTKVITLIILPALPPIILKAGQSFNVLITDYFQSPNDFPKLITTAPDVPWLTLDSVAKSARGTIPITQAAGDIALIVSGTTSLGIPFVRIIPIQVLPASAASASNGAPAQSATGPLASQVASTAIPVTTSAGSTASPYPTPTLIPGEPFAVPLLPFLLGLRDTVSAIKTNPVSPWIGLNDLKSGLVGIVPITQPEGPITVTISAVEAGGALYTNEFTIIVAPRISSSATLVPLPTPTETTFRTPTVTPGVPFTIPLGPFLPRPDVIGLSITTDPLSGWIGLGTPGSSPSISGVVPLDRLPGLISVTINGQLPGAIPFTITFRVAVAPRPSSATTPSGAASTSLPTPEITPGEPFNIPIGPYLPGLVPVLVGSIISLGSTQPLSDFIKLVPNGPEGPSLQGVAPIDKAPGLIIATLGGLDTGGMAITIPFPIRVVPKLPASSSTVIPSVVPSGTSLPTPTITAGLLFLIDATVYLRSPVDVVGSLLADPSYPWIALDPLRPGLGLISGIVPIDAAPGTISITLIARGSSGDMYTVKFLVVIIPGSGGSSSQSNDATSRPPSLPSGTAGASQTSSPTAISFPIQTIVPGVPFDFSTLPYLRDPKDILQAIQATPFGLFSLLPPYDITGTAPLDTLPGSYNTILEVLGRDGLLYTVTVPLLVTPAATTASASIIHTSTSLPTPTVTAGIPFDVSCLQYLSSPSDIVQSISTTLPPVNWINVGPLRDITGIPPLDTTPGPYQVVLVALKNSGGLYTVTIPLVVLPATGASAIAPTTTSAQLGPSSTILPAPTITAGVPFSIPLLQFLRGLGDQAIAATFSPTVPFIKFDTSLQALTGTAPPSTPEGTFSVTLTISPPGSGASPYGITFTVIVRPASTSTGISSLLTTTSSVPSATSSIPAATVTAGFPFNIDIHPYLKSPDDSITGPVTSLPYYQWFGFDQVKHGITGLVPPTQPEGTFTITLPALGLNGLPYTVTVPVVIVPALAASNPSAVGLGTSTISAGATASSPSPTTSGVPIPVQTVTQGSPIVIPLLLFLHSATDDVQSVVAVPPLPSSASLTLGAAADLEGVISLDTPLGLFTALISVRTAIGTTYQLLLPILVLPAFGSGSTSSPSTTLIVKLVFIKLIFNLFVKLIFNKLSIFNLFVKLIFVKLSIFNLFIQLVFIKLIFNLFVKLIFNKLSIFNLFVKLIFVKLSIFNLFVKLVFVKLSIFNLFVKLERGISFSIMCLLYQVRRGSDNAVINISVLSAGGVANSAAQDTFCAGTTCLITIIYDQSGHGNHLTQAPPGNPYIGPQANGYDDLASAIGAPVLLNGQKVYGVFVAPGTGYRNNVTTGIATGDMPEGIYTVVDGTHYNGGCCFNYGNTERNSTANGPGHMEAVYYGTCSLWGTGSGTGPWALADFEGGLYSTNTMSKSLAVPVNVDRFFTAILKGRPANWALRGSNAATGLLSTYYNGTRPAGYNPMQKEGAVVLGTGGNNYNFGQGTFYEGALTTGYPSDITENLVQANIVAAKYTTTSLNGGPAITIGSSLSLQLTTPGYTTQYIAHTGNTVNTQVVNATSILSLKQQASWTVRVGLANTDCFSFESRDTPGTYLYHAYFQLRVAAPDGSQGFRETATFCTRAGLNGQGISILSWAYPTRYIRHYLNVGYVASNGGPLTWDVTASFSNDVSFLVSAAFA